MKYRDIFLENEVAANTAGDGCVDGIGVGEKGEPGYPVDRKKKKEKAGRSILAIKGLGKSA